MIVLSNMTWNIQNVFSCVICVMASAPRKGKRSKFEKFIEKYAKYYEQLATICRDENDEIALIEQENGQHPCLRSTENIEKLDEDFIKDNERENDNVTSVKTEEVHTGKVTQPSLKRCELCGIASKVVCRYTTIAWCIYLSNNIIPLILKSFPRIDGLQGYRKVVLSSWLEEPVYEVSKQPNQFNFNPVEMFFLKNAIGIEAILFVKKPSHFGNVDELTVESNCLCLHCKRWEHARVCITDIF